MGQQQVEGGRIGHKAAGRGDDRLGMNLDGLLQRPPLVAPIGVHAVERLDLGDAAAGELLNLAAQFHEGKSQVFRQHLPEGGFACAAQSDEGDARTAACVVATGAEHLAHGGAHPMQGRFVPVFEQLAQQQPFRRGGGHVSDQLGQTALQRLGDLQQDQNGRVSHSAFQVGEVALRNVRGDGHGLARQAAARAQGAHPLSECDQEGVARVPMGGPGGGIFGRSLTGKLQYIA